jgi:hypothetical protein
MNGIRGPAPARLSIPDSGAGLESNPALGVAYLSPPKALDGGYAAQVPNPGPHAPAHQCRLRTRGDPVARGQQRPLPYQRPACQNAL